MNSQLTMKLVVSVLVLVSCTFASDFSSSARNFSLEFLYHTQLESGEHIVISPLGIWSLMTALVIGAEGESQSQLLKALRLPTAETSVNSDNYENFELSILSGYESVMSTVLDTADGSVDLISRNYMLVAESFKVNPQYKRKLRNFLKTLITNLNLDTATGVAESANELIKKSGAMTSDLFQPEDFSISRFIITNVIKFKGNWKIPFNESATKVEPFYDENKNKIGEANMMFKEDAVRYSNVQTLQSSVLELPYGNDENNVFISTAVHNANIEVTETGMPGPVVTAAEFQDRVLSSFEANRPFIYFGMQKLTATIIFSGIYSKPSVL
ncbi:serine protease inhibitor 77Ba-like [Aricia agestis]|uniref:serine protease inhibitor 77Ba-like n=1 Tax=Aricia agestis TaxID=91739 RepID=UPI001C205624|nr:serine protease inhibitor 77Ba-like [Aricia agestis]